MIATGWYGLTAETVQFAPSSPYTPLAWHSSCRQSPLSIQSLTTPLKSRHGYRQGVSLDPVSGEPSVSSFRCGAWTLWAFRPQQPSISSPAFSASYLPAIASPLLTAPSTRVEKSLVEAMGLKALRSSKIAEWPFSSSSRCCSGLCRLPTVLPIHSWATLPVSDLC